MSEARSFNHYLENDPFSGILEPIDRAFLLASAEILTLDAQETLFTIKTPATSLYYVVKGTVSLTNTEALALVLKPGMVFGEESFLKQFHHAFKAVATEPTILLRFSAPLSQKLVDHNAQFRHILLNGLLLKLLPQAPSPRISKKEEVFSLDGSVTLLSAATKWGLSLLVPLFTYIFMRTYDIDLNVHLLTTLLSAVLCLWSFSLVPAYSAALLMLTGSLLLNLVSPVTLLTKFSTDSFLILAFSLSLGAALQTSSLGHRFMLKILKFMPPTHFWTNIALFTLSALYTPFVPSSASRQKMIQKIVRSFNQQLALTPTSATAQKLALSAYAGTTLLGPIFLTSSVYNIFILGVLRNDQSHFQWWEWFSGTVPTGFFLLLFFALSLGFFFREDQVFIIFRERVECQLKIMGPLESQDLHLLGLLSLYIIALCTPTIHGLSEGFIALLMLCLFMVFYFNPLKKPLKKTDDILSSVVLFISLSSLMTTFNLLNVYELIQPTLGIFQYLCERDFTLFALTIGLTLTFARLFIPYGLTVFLASLIFLPFARLQGINPWLMGFLILLFSKESLFPTARGALQKFLNKTLIPDAQPRTLVLKYHLLIIIIKFLAVYCSIPFWKEMSLV